MFHTSCILPLFYVWHTEMRYNLICKSKSAVIRADLVNTKEGVHITVPVAADCSVPAEHVDSSTTHLKGT